MGYCKTTLYVDAKLKQENTFRQAHAYTYPKPAQTRRLRQRLSGSVPYFLITHVHSDENINCTT